MIAIISSIRLPRPSHGTPQRRKSSGQGLRPTPRLKRSPVITATDAACFATSTGCRIGSFTTKVWKRRRWVTIPSAGMSENGSMNGLSSRNWRLPSGV